MLCVSQAKVACFVYFALLKMDKFNWENIRMGSRHISLWAVCGLILGLYFSRALISISMILLMVVSLYEQLQPSKRNNFYKQWIWTLPIIYFLFMFISGLWSSNTTYYFTRIQTLLPFVALPIGMYSLKHWKVKQFTFVMILFIICTTVGNLYSLWQYIQHKEIFDIAYSYAKTIPTPFKNDHIRYSIAVVMSSLFCLYFFLHSKSESPKAIALGVLIFNVVYLHILSAKTGLLALYTLSCIGIIYLLLSKKYWLKGLLIATVIVVLPWLMFNVSNTFRAKYYYVKYSIEQILNQQKENNISDEGRLISYTYAIRIIQKHPWMGVGYGDVFDVMEQQYRADFGQQDVKILLPHNQWLMAAIAAGIFAAIIFSIWLILLVYTYFMKHWLLIGVFLLMLIALLIEPLVETQYGATIFLWAIFFLIPMYDVLISNSSKPQRV